jgi:hypothetical protein
MASPGHARIAADKMALATNNYRWPVSPLAGWPVGLPRHFCKKMKLFLSLRAQPAQLENGQTMWRNSYGGQNHFN